MNFYTKTILITLTLLFLPSFVNGATIGRPMHNAGLIGYWPMDEAGGLTAFDRSGNLNDGTLTSMDASTDWVSGQHGGALDFDGASAQHINIPDTDQLDLVGSDITVSAWINARSAGQQSNGRILDKNGGAGDGWTLNMQSDADNNFTWQINGVSRSSNTDVITFGQWHFLTTVWDSSAGQVSFYIDGAFLNLSTSFSTGGPAASTLAVRIGNRDSDEAREFDGAIDEVRIYNRALSADEVRRLYNLGRPRLGVSPKNRLTNGLVGYWTFDGVDTAGVTTYDVSTNSNDGTLTGGPTRTIGILGQALDFDGTNDYVAVGNTTETLQTISFWMYAHDVTTRDIMDFDGTDMIEINGSSAITATSFPAATVYVDGVVASTVTVNTWHFITITDTTGVSASALDIGRETSDSVNEFDGLLDEIRVYDRVLSADEVSELYNLTRPSGFNKIKKNRITDGLVGHWTFDGPDIAGVIAYDATTNNNDGTLTGGPTRTIGKIGQALKFDGVDDFIDAGSDASVDNLFTGGGTIAAWVNIDGFGETGNGRIVDKGNGTDHDEGWIFAVRSGNSGLSFIHGDTTGTNDGQWLGGTLSTTAGWQHVVVTYSTDDFANNNAQFYVDGVATSTVEQSVPSGSPTDDSVETLTIGSDDTGARSFDGLIDEVRIYNRVLTTQEINALYQMGR